MPRKQPTTKDLERGLRLAEVRKKIWGSRDVFSKSTQIPAATLFNWEKHGVDISCEGLAVIAEHGGDIEYILTGQITKPDVNDVDEVYETLQHRIKELETENSRLKAVNENNPAAVPEIELSSRIGDCVSLLGQLGGIARQNPAARVFFLRYLSELQQTLEATLDDAKAAQAQDQNTNQATG